MGVVPVRSRTYYARRGSDAEKNTDSESLIRIPSNSTFPSKSSQSRVPSNLRPPFNRSLGIYNVPYTSTLLLWYPFFLKLQT